VDLIVPYCEARRFQIVKTKEAVMDNQSKADERNTVMVQASYPKVIRSMIEQIKCPVTRVYGNQVVKNIHVTGTLDSPKHNSAVEYMRSDLTDHFFLGQSLGKED
jgi:hypothetical protein